MKKQKYVRAEMQITTFETEDVLTTSLGQVIDPPVLDGDDTEIL